MVDLRPRVQNISALARELGSDYSHLHAVLRGDDGCSKKLARRIEAATHGRIRAWELLGLQDGPPPVLPSSLPEAS